MFLLDRTLTEGGKDRSTSPTMTQGRKPKICLVTGKVEKQHHRLLMEG